VLVKKTPLYIRIFFSIFALVVFFFSFSADLKNRQMQAFFSDEASYFSITQSIAYDGDLRYEKKDIVRIREHFGTPVGLFLKKGKDGNIYFAKSFAYPLVAAPFYRLARIHGLLLLNGIMLILSILFSFLFLRRYHDDSKSFSFSLIFLFSTVAWIYIWWMQPDFFNFFTVFAGLFFFFYPFTHSWHHYFSVLFFVLAILSKPSNIVPIGIVFLILVHRRQWKRLLISGLLVLLLALPLAYYLLSQTGELNFMGGDRRSFHSQFPFERPGYTFDLSPQAYKMTADDYADRWKRLAIDPAMVTMNFFYYLFGRYTGILIYFPIALFLLIGFVFQRKELEDWYILAAIIGGVLIYIAGTPDNYFGGSGSLGNRYFLNLLPFFFFLGHRHRSFHLAWLPMAVAAVFLTATFTDGLANSYIPRSTGNRFPVNLFPVEKTQIFNLPTNENYRAFYQSIGQKYHLFFVNDHFYQLEGDYFWTQGNHPTEVLVLAPAKVGEFRIELGNHARPNRVFLRLENIAKKIALKPREQILLNLKPVLFTKLGNRYIYYLRVHARATYSPYFEEPEGGDDRLLLGVKTRIELVY